MRCEQFDRRIDELLDQRRPLLDDARLQRHAQYCEDCRQLLSAHVLLEELTSRPRQIRDRSSPRVPSFSPRFVAAALLCLAASLLFVGSSDWGRLPQKSVEIQRHGHRHLVPRPLARGISSAQETGYLVHQPIVSLRLLSRGDWTQSVEAMSMPFAAQLPEVERHWVQAMATGMSPLQDPLTSTWKLIRQSVTPAASKTEVSS